MKGSTLVTVVSTDRFDPLSHLQDAYNDELVTAL
jgi:hypothetical protein